MRWRRLGLICLIELLRNIMLVELLVFSFRWITWLDPYILVKRFRTTKIKTLSSSGCLRVTHFPKYGAFFHLRNSVYYWVKYFSLKAVPLPYTPAHILTMLYIHLPKYLMKGSYRNLRHAKTFWHRQTPPYLKMSYPQR